MTVKPPPGVGPRRRWAIRLIVRALIAPSLISADERQAVADWLSSVNRGGELRYLDLRAAIKARGLTVAQFAAQVGVTDRVVRYWLRHERSVTRQLAIKIGKVLGVSRARILTSFVIRKDTSPSTLPPYDESLHLVGRNLAAARVICKLTQDQLAKIAGVDPHIVAACESATHSPTNGRALLEVQTVVANRLRRRGYRTATVIARPRRRRSLGDADHATQQGSAPAAAD